MSLKWYKNAVLDETQEAYGKTWRVDRIETDGTIVFRCGKETALAPRTDKEYFSGIVIKSVEIPLNTSPAVTCDLTLNPCLQIGLKAEDFQVTGEVVSYFPNGVDNVDTHNQRVVDFADSLETEPELKQMVVDAMSLSPVDIAMRKRKMLEGLPTGAKFYVHDEITWDRALSVEETLTVRSWCTQNWPGTFEIVGKLPDRRTGQEGRTVAKKGDLKATAAASPFISTDFANLERKAAQISGSAEQLYGYYSAKARNVAGLVQYKQSDGSIVEVTCIGGKDYTSGWDDQVCLGTVTQFVKRIEDGRNRRLFQTGFPAVS